MAKIRITVSVDINLNEMAAEYGTKKLTQDDARELLKDDVRAWLNGVAYSEAIKNLDVK